MSCHTLAFDPGTRAANLKVSSSSSSELPTSSIAGGNPLRRPSNGDSRGSRGSMPVP